MSLAWTIELTRAAERQLQKMDKPVAAQLSRFLFERVATRQDPQELGAALSGPLKGLWRFRVGDYRIICEIRDAELVVLALGTGHRKEIYH